MENPEKISLELQSQFIRMYKIAIADNDFSALELKMLYDFARDRNIPERELDKILFQAQGEFVIPEHLEDKIKYLYDLSLMIWADGIVTEDEENTLKKFCKRFGFDEEAIENLSKYLIENAREKVAVTEITQHVRDTFKQKTNG